MSYQWRVKVKKFKVDENVVAPVIYGDQPHQICRKGYVLSSALRDELRIFLTHYNNFVGVEQTPYYRIDAYAQVYGGDSHTPAPVNHLDILEINASFVDGWGTALNLARASGIAIHPRELVFPKHLATMNSIYRPELDLFVAELAALGQTDHRIVEWSPEPSEPTYVYGRVGSRETPTIIPYDGIRLDNKLNLARFGNVKWLWREGVRIPKHFIGETHEWADIPATAVLKFCDKGSDECLRTRTSVIFGKPQGNAPALKRFFREGKLLAQVRVQEDRHHFLEGDFLEHRAMFLNAQIVILAIGNEPVTGYVQYSPKMLINDNSYHGPLQIC